ncbi:exonuclease [Pedobacter sp. BS3]|uniref:exonuclease domain-containing protein n=1 Tax=Pedobacter sp. BS3 TaxID=2567937 RepID=UPI0011ECB250|nr:exonuclease domain-containing protein [Pedobacter sp. BS3]TZF81765.1 exonuclease [Pedobacter sp. BS3]
MKSFTAIDFETAHGKRWSICQIGLVRVKNGIITQKLSGLIQPPDNYYRDKFSNIHGITSEQTADAQAFDEIWEQIGVFIRFQHIVAHNGFAFNFPCLRQTLKYYNLAFFPFVGHCTHRIFGNDLASLCKQYNIPFNHHDALSNAMACAELFLIHLKNKERL